MGKLGFGLLLALLAAGCASSPVDYLPDGSPVRGRSFSPTPEDGYVTLNCMAELDGSLSDCRVVKESPEGLGMGDLVLKRVAEAKLNSQSRSQAGRVEFTTYFRANE
jgi:hypothetical protein